MSSTSIATLCASLLLSLAAALCIYLIVLNRYLLLLHDRWLKTAALRIVLIALVIGAVIFGWWAAGSSWPLLPIGVLAGVLAGEIHRMLLRRLYVGEPPVATENAGVSWRRPITTTDLAVYHYTMRALGWAGPRLRIAHISDLHLNGDLSSAYYQAAMDRVMAAEPDLVFVTGDLVTRLEYAPALPDVLGQVRGRLGTFAILGNHDYWLDAEKVRDGVRAAGVTLIGDHCVRLTIAGRPVTICGDELPWSRPIRPAPPAPAGELALMLTHTPDNIYRLSRLGYAAVFAGHYHAGQLRLPWLGPLVIPSRYGRRFDHGHFVVAGTHLFVTAGVGSAVPPRRIYCQPDIFLVDIHGFAQ